MIYIDIGIISKMVKNFKRFIINQEREFNIILKTNSVFTKVKKITLNLEFFEVWRWLIINL